MQKKETKGKMKNKEVIIAAIVALTVMEVVALLMEVNGVLLTIVIAAVAGLAGWVIPQPKLK